MEPIEAVEKALAFANHRLAAAPSFAIYQSIQAQLTYLLGVLKGTESDRSRLNEINFGVYAAKEFEDSDPEFAQVLRPAFWVAAQLAKGLKVLTCAAMMNEDMQQQNGDVQQKQTSSAEGREDKVPESGRLKKCLRRAGQWICMILVACFAFCCLVLYQNRGHNPYCGSTCTSVEVDMNRIIADIADYFAIPAHTALGPTPIFIGPQACMKNGIQFSALRGKNTGKITGDTNKITISVFDAAGLCPKSYQEAAHGWNNGVFTKTIESNN